jgi:hypothetical protein
MNFWHNVLHHLSSEADTEAKPSLFEFELNALHSLPSISGVSPIGHLESKVFSPYNS